MPHDWSSVLQDVDTDGPAKEPHRFLHEVWNSPVLYRNSRLLTGGASPGMSGMSLLCGFTIWQWNRMDSIRQQP